MIARCFQIRCGILSDVFRFPDNTSLACCICGRDNGGTRPSVQHQVDARPRDQHATAPSARVYSYRSARIGSIRLARRAGMSPAAADTTVSSITVKPVTVGSCAWMPYNWAAT